MPQGGTINVPEQPHLRAGDRAAPRNRPAGGVRDVGAGDHAGHTPRQAVDHHPTRLRPMGAHLRNALWHWTSDPRRGNGVELMSIYKRKYLLLMKLFIISWSLIN